MGEDEDKICKIELVGKVDLPKAYKSLRDL